MCAGAGEHLSAPPSSLEEEPSSEHEPGVLMNFLCLFLSHHPPPRPQSMLGAHGWPESVWGRWDAGSWETWILASLPPTVSVTSGFPSVGPSCQGYELETLGLA